MLAKRSLRIFLAILVLQLLLLLIFVFFRLIDYDEGLYLFYAQLVQQGNLPYLDFFYPQMPYLPYACAAVSGWGFSSLFLSRLISAFFGLLTSVLLFWLVYKLTRDDRSSLIVFFLYGFNGLAANWHSVIKTLVFSDFFALLSFCCFALYLLSTHGRRGLLTLPSGFFIGLAFSFRLVLLPLLLMEGILLFFLSPGRTGKDKILDLLRLLLGAAVGSSLSIYLLIKGPSAFLFGNIGYHLIWGNQAIRMTLEGRLFTLSKFVFYPQNLLILTLAILGAALLIRRARISRLTSEERVVAAAILCSLVLIVTFFFMSPTQFQYYEQALPYLLICSIPVLPRLGEKLKEKRWHLRVVGAIYFALILPFVVIFVFSIRDRDKPWELSTVREVVKTVQANSQPDEIILSAWPGYAVLSRREVPPGLETWGGGVIPFLSPKQVADFKLINDARVEKLIKERAFTLIVREEWFPRHLDDLIRPNYDLVKTLPFTQVYAVKDH